MGAKNNNKGKYKGKMNLLHWNKGSARLENKVEELEDLFQQYKPDILGLSEANLYPDTDTNKIQFENYSLYTCPTLNNPELRVSRVVVYVHNSLIVKSRPDLEDSGLSSIWLELGHKGSKKILVCNIYREWQYMHQQDKSSLSNASQLLRWERFIESWKRALEEDKEVIVMGDINIDSLSWGLDDIVSSDRAYRQKELINLLFEQIFPLGVSQHVQVPTLTSNHGQSNEKACLDHVYTNNPEKLSNVVAHFNGGSDHKVIQVIRYTKKQVRKQRYIRKRSYKHFDSQKFENDIRNTQWFDVYTTNDVNTAVELFTLKFNNVLDNHAPIKTIQLHKNYAPWLNEQTKKIMRQRDSAQKIAATTNHPDDRRQYRHLRNAATAQLKKAKADWEANKVDEKVTDNPKDMWTNLKSIMGWKTNGTPTQLIDNGNVVNSPKELASTMNNYFIDKIKKLEANLPPPTGDPLEHLKKVMEGRQCEFSLKQVHPLEVEEIVKNLKNSSSTGMDEICTSVIKLALPYILPAITHIINLSIETLTFPESWKLAKIIPLFKKEDPLLPKNYRPVALLSVLSKVLERVVFRQVTRYLEDNDLVHPSLHGSRAGHSTATAITEMYDSWMSAAENGEMAAVMMIDLSAAFDLVNHDLLLKKLSLYGFDQNAVVWFWSYLTGRSQQVFIDGQFSEKKAVFIGVPQGSILGVLLYNLFGGDLPEVVHGNSKQNTPEVLQDNEQNSTTDAMLDSFFEVTSPEGLQSNKHHECTINETLSNEAKYTSYCKVCGNLCTFVDDSTYTCIGTCPANMSSNLTSQYQKLAEYMGNNRLVINPDKTRLVVMGTKKHDKTREQIFVNTGSAIIHPIENEKLLGLNVHQSMKWGNHVISNRKSLINTLSTRLKGLKYISKAASFKTRLMVANACFMSILTYMIVIWGGTEDYIIRSAQVMQNKAAKLVTRTFDLYTPTRVLLKQCGWLSVRQLIFYHSVLQIWKTRRSLKPWHIHSNLIESRTRSANIGNLKIPVTTTALAAKSFMVRAPNFWNETPPEIRACESLNTFKKNLKKFIILKVPID